MKHNETTIGNLLDLDNIRYVIDEQLGLWVKFDVKKVEVSTERPDGIRYSLTLHDRFNVRIMGFDNAHAVEHGGKRHVAPTRAYDHWHRDGANKVFPYQYENAEKLIKDFWKEVDDRLKQLQENKT